MYTLYIIYITFSSLILGKCSQALNCELKDGSCEFSFYLCVGVRRNIKLYHLLHKMHLYPTNYTHVRFHLNLRKY